MQAVAIKQVRKVPRRYKPFAPVCGHHTQVTAPPESDGQNRIALHVCTRCGVEWRSVSFEKGAQVP